MHTKLLAPNDLISLSYRTQDCVRNNNVYYELKKIQLKYFSATRPVLEDFLGFLKVSLSRHNNENYSYKIRNLYTGSKIWEGLFIDINGGNLCRTFTIGNIYWPPRDDNNNINIQRFISAYNRDTSK